MKTRKEWIFQVREQLRATSPDMRLSNRMISHRLETMLDLLVRRDSHTRKIWKQTDLFESQRLTFSPLSSNRSQSDQTIPDVFQTSYGTPYLQLRDDYTGHVYNPSTPQTKAGQTGRFYYLDQDRIIVGLAEPPTLTAYYFAKAHKRVACQSELDVTLPVPDHLADPLLSATLNELLKVTDSILPDTFANNNELQRQSPVRSPEGIQRKTA